MITLGRPILEKNTRLNWLSFRWNMLGIGENILQIKAGISPINPVISLADTRTLCTALGGVPVHCTFIFGLDRGPKVWIEEPRFGLKDQGLNRGTKVWIEEPRFGSRNQGLDRGTKVWIEEPRFELRDPGLDRGTKVWIEEPRFGLRNQGLDWGTKFSVPRSLSIINY